MIPTPYDGSAKPFTIGLAPLDPTQWIDIGDDLDEYLAEKKRLYTEESTNVFAAEPGMEAAQQEVYDLLVAHLSTHHPDLQKNDGDREDLPWLARAGLLVPEDLVLMRPSAEGWRLVAASLCFPSAWTLREKFGKPLHAVHAPVPGFGAGSRNDSLINRMFDNLWPERPVLRWNWTLFGKTPLYHPAKVGGTSRRFGEGPIASDVTIRVERQTLRKLPKSGDVLFTIRTYREPVEALEQRPDGAALAQAIIAQVKGFSDEELRYKGLQGETARVIARLQQIGN